MNEQPKNLELMETADDAYIKAEALLSAIIACEKGEGFYALSHQYSHAYIASINTEVVRLKQSIDGLYQLFEGVQP